MADVDARLQKYRGPGATNLSKVELQTARNELAGGRRSLMTSINGLPSNNPTALRAYDLVDRVNDELGVLDALIRAADAKAATAREAADDRTEVFAAAEKQAPQPYCDRQDTPQHAAPCELDPSTRSLYRGHVTNTVMTAQINWLAAINALKLEEKLRGKEVRFEQVLGGLIFDTLLFVFANAAKSIVHMAVDGGAKILATEEHIYGAVATEGPSREHIETVKKIADKGVDKGSKYLGTALKSSQVADKARPAVPGNVEEFIGSLKGLPAQWSFAITSNLPYLLDEDLAALVVGLPDADTLTQPYFEGKVVALVERFKAQVMAVNENVLTVKVVTARGVRHALVTPEKERSAALHGEWRGSSVNTGRWTFVRWIDEDMSTMAIAHASSYDSNAAYMMRTPMDGTFWSTESLQVLGEQQR